MKAFPKPTRPLEYVAFFNFQLNTQQGPAFVFVAIDAYLGYAFNLGVEPDNKPETVLKKIYLLTEHPEFVRYMDKGYTLVLEEHPELSERIEAIIKPSKGKLLFDKTYNNHLANPFLLGLRDSLFKSEKF
jgi:hypothetical protein